MKIKNIQNTSPDSTDIFLICEIAIEVSKHSQFWYCSHHGPVTDRGLAWGHGPHFEWHH